MISLGIGDPDRPTPPLIVEAMQEAVTEPETHQYPSNRGREDFRAAVRDFYAAPLRRRRSTPTARSSPRSAPRRRSSTSTSPSWTPATTRSPPTPATPSTPAARGSPGAEPVLMALEPEHGFVPDLGAIDEDVAQAREADVPQLPQQPDRRGRARRVLRARRRVRARLRDPRRPRQRLLGDRLRRLPRAVVPRHARRQGRRHRGLLAVQGLQHDRLALRGGGRQRRGARRPTGG